MADKNVKYGVNLDTANENLVDAEIKKLKIDPGATLADKVGQLVGHYRKNFDAKKLAKCDCGGVFPEEYKACPYCGDADDAEPAKPGPKVAPSADKAKPAVAIIESPKAKTKAAEIVKGVDDKLAGLTSKDLDYATQEVLKLKGNSASAMWELGAKLREIHERQLWKLRVDDKGKASYRSFEAYCVAEVKMSGTGCFQLIHVAENYTAEKVRELGTSKLNLILKAPEEDRPDLENAAKGGLTKSQLAKKVKELRDKKGAPKTKSTTAAGKPAPPPGKGRKSEHITIVSVIGKKTVPMSCKPEKKGDELKPVECPKAVQEFIARTVPFAVDDLTNGVREILSLACDSKGRLQIRINRQRIDE